MCPDRELLSAYVDGEVPEPWNGRLGSHIAGCEDCKRVVERFRALSDRLRSERVEGAELSAILENARVRIDATLASRAPVLAPRPAPGPASASTTELWRRRVALPLPAAAAAALVVAVLLALSLSGALAPRSGAGSTLAAVTQSGPIQAMATAAELPTPSGGQSISIDDLLRYLEARNGQSALTIRLPSGASFENSGTPVIQVVGPPQKAKGGLR